MKILAVDDNESNRQLIYALLRQDGHSVILAEDGEQAYNLFSSEEIDMVLMDIMMPVMDGYEATKLIKEKSKSRFVPVIFVTAATDDMTLAKCIDVGGDDFITKPYNRIILKAKINALSRISGLYKTVQEQRDVLKKHQMRLDLDHQLGERIYDSILNHGNLISPCIKSISRPTEKFSGDVILTAALPSGGVNILVGDVTGHGLSAAICALPVSELFYSMSTKGFMLHQIISAINEKLSDVLMPEMFFAAAFISILPEGHSCGIWNGGLPDVLIVGKNRGITKKIKSSHLPLGILGKDEFDGNYQITEINPDDRIIIHTDGLMEATNILGEQFSQDRIDSLVNRFHDPDRLIKEINNELDQFMGETKMLDDITSTFSVIQNY